MKVNQTIPTRTPNIAVAQLTVLLGLLTAFAAFSTDMYLAAFPAMAQDMGTDIGRIQLTLSVFFFGLAAGQMLYGPLSDRFGRRSPLLAGLVLYTVASAALVVVRNVDLFLVLRFLQAVGACAGMIIGRAVIRDIFDIDRSAKILTMMMAVQAIGPIAAPIIGGYVLIITTWPSVFGLMVLLGVGCLIASHIVLPESLPAESRVRHNLGQVFSVFGALLKKRDFIVPCLAGALGGAGIFVFISASPFVLMTLYGLDEAQYGWAFATVGIGTTLLAQINHVLLKRFAPRQVLAGALVVMFLFGGAISALMLWQPLPNLMLLMGFLVMALGTVPMIYANSAAVAMAASGEFAGSASALIGTTQFVVAGLASTLTGVFHNGTALPMTSLIVCCGAAGFLMVTLGSRIFSTIGQPVEPTRASSRL